MSKTIACKSSVRLKQITPAFIYGMLVLRAMLRHADCPPEGLVITSLNDSTHDPNSRHYSGEAWDIRTHGFDGNEALGRFLVALLAMLGPSFTVLLESPDAPNEHLHVQVVKGQHFEWALVAGRAAQLVVGV